MITPIIRSNIDNQYIIINATNHMRLEMRESVSFTKLIIIDKGTLVKSQPIKLPPQNVSA